MSALSQGRVGRLSQLSPFELERYFNGADRPRIAYPESAYGCVEWFHYPEQPGRPPATAEKSTRQWRTPRS